MGVNMDQAAIREAADLAWDEVARARGELDVAIARARVVQVQCNHPNIYKTSCMGDNGTHCPDCRYAT